jgi:catalase-peroxidase
VLLSFVKVRAGVGPLLVLSLLTGVQASGCPYLKQQQQNVNANMHRQLQTRTRNGDGGIPDGGYSAVKEDIKTILTDSKAFFPADFEAPLGPNYGGLMIRLAWHCSGSYRESDGRGGCDGARIRFDPELNWPDNANLNNARKLLEPIKEKYGSKLSWGDLIILAGDAAIESMGGPILGFCGGRIDDVDGGDSLILGPSNEQEAISACQSLERTMQGECNLVDGSPIGPSTVGLIYVNPAGPKGSEGDPVASGADIRRAFSNMGFNDTETVSLVGGGHAFGKCHGACDSPPCGQGTELEGIGPNTFTSGFEGAWTSTPTTWSNQYFRNIFDFEWNLITGPGGKIQWEPKNADGTDGPDIMMLTTDIAMAQDSIYKSISEAYGADLELLNNDFGHAWYKLTSADMGPSSRCLGDEVLPPQSFQNPLPDVTATTSATIDYVSVRTKIQEIVDADSANGPAFVNLAYRCASTYRDTDYKGGCNGARIRFAPEKDWEANAGTQDAIDTLAPIKDSYPQVSMADIIVLAGQTAIESVGNPGTAMAFCGGRVDAEDANGSDSLAPRVYFPAVVSVRDDMQVKGLTAREGVALAGRDSLSNQFYKDLKGSEGGFSAEELALIEDAEFSAIVAEYADNPETFLMEFQMAWTKMMVADRFAGSLENACTGVNDQTLAADDDESADSSTVVGMQALSVVAVAIAGLALF